MTLPRSTPTAQDVDARGLLGFLDAAERNDLGLHSLVVARHGHVVAEGWWTPYAADRVHLAYSLSKTLTATAVGLLVAEGRLSVQDRVLDHLPDADRTAAAPGWEHVRVEHCLSMTVGHDVDVWDRVHDRSAAHPASSGPVDWLPGVLMIPLDHEPGTHFAYNQVATYLLALVVRNLSGTGVTEVLRSRVLDPLGIGEVPWHRDPLGREIGFSGAHLTTEAIASLAQLHLDEGRWQGRPLLDPDWVAEATVGYGPLNRDPEAGPDWRRGYGYSFWMQQHGFRGDGAFGQFLLVLPEQDAVVAITSENDDMQATLEAVWGHVVPALGAPGDEAADAELADRLARAELPALGSAAVSYGTDPLVVPVTGGDLTGDWSQVRLSGSHLALRRGEEWLEVLVGDGTWAESVLVADGWSLPVAASGGWQAGETYRADVLVVETPHRFHLEVRDGAATLTWRMVPLNGADPFRSAVRPAG